MVGDVEELGGGFEVLEAGIGLIGEDEIGETAKTFDGGGGMFVEEEGELATSEGEIGDKVFGGGVVEIGGDVDEKEVDGSGGDGPFGEGAVDGGEIGDVVGERENVAGGEGGGFGADLEFVLAEGEVGVAGEDVVTEVKERFGGGGGATEDGGLFEIVKAGAVQGEIEPGSVLGVYFWSEVAFVKFEIGVLNDVADDEDIAHGFILA